jgi:hypothetical protein
MYITRDKKTKKITGFAKKIPQVYDEQKKKYLPDENYEKINEKSKELQDFLNGTGEYKKPKKPNYDINKQFEILENEIPALKKYRKMIRGE